MDGSGESGGEAILQSLYDLDGKKGNLKRF